MGVPVAELEGSVDKWRPDIRPAVIIALVYVQDSKPIGAKTVDLEWSRKPDRLRKFRLPGLQNAGEVQRGLVVSFSTRAVIASPTC